MEEVPDTGPENPPDRKEEPLTESTEPGSSGQQTENEAAEQEAAEEEVGGG